MSSRQKLSQKSSRETEKPENEFSNLAERVVQLTNLRARLETVEPRSTATLYCSIEYGSRPKSLHVGTSCSALLLVCLKHGSRPKSLRVGTSCSALLLVSLQTSRKKAGPNSVDLSNRTGRYQRIGLRESSATNRAD
jgi:hypothetical protein